MPKLSLNASKKTKHTPAGEIPVDWGWLAFPMSWPTTNPACGKSGELHLP
jgi:hypothetical protein